MMTISVILAARGLSENSQAGPGGKAAAFGGIWLTCRVALPSELPVYVDPSWSILWPMFYRTM